MVSRQWNSSPISFLPDSLAVCSTVYPFMHSLQDRWETATYPLISCHCLELWSVEAPHLGSWIVVGFLLLSLNVALSFYKYSSTYFLCLNMMVQVHTGFHFLILPLKPAIFLRTAALKKEWYLKSNTEAAWSSAHRSTQRLAWGLRSVPKTHVLERENWLPNTVLRPPYRSWAHMPTQKIIHVKNYFHFKKHKLKNMLSERSPKQGHIHMNLLI